MNEPTRDPGERLRNLVAALDDEPPTDEEAREVVAALGVDIPALAARIRAQAARAPANAAARRMAELRLAQEADAARARERAPEPVRPRAEQLDRVRELMARAASRGKAASVAAHFRKFEEAGDEELRALATALRDLLDEEDEGEDRR